jgi:hypothetical protein
MLPRTARVPCRCARLNSNVRAHRALDLALLTVARFVAPIFAIFLAFDWFTLPSSIEVTPAKTDQAFAFREIPRRENVALRTNGYAEPEVNCREQPTFCRRLRQGNIKWPIAVLIGKPSMMQGLWVLHAESEGIVLIARNEQQSKLTQAKVAIGLGTVAVGGFAWLLWAFRPDRHPRASAP